MPPLAWIRNEELAVIWKTIPGSNGKYEVSNFGAVRSKGHFELKRRYDRGGYYGFFIRLNGVQRRYWSHRLVLEAFGFPQPDGMEVNHKNGIRDDNRPENLEWVTRRQNSHHKKSLGTWPSGENNGRAVLTWPLVRAIRGLLAQGNMQKHLAAKFGVSYQLISEIHRGRCWVEVVA